MLAPITQTEGIFLFSCLMLINDLLGTVFTHSRTERVFGMFLWWWHGSSAGVTGQKKHWRIFASCWYPADMSEELNKVFPSDDAQSCSPIKIFLFLNLWKSHCILVLSQSVACSAMSPTPYFASSVERKSVDKSGSAHHLLLLYCLLSKLELEVLQLSS